MEDKSVEPLRLSVQQLSRHRTSRFAGLTLSEAIYALPQELFDIIHKHVFDLPTHTIIQVNSSYCTPKVLQLNSTLRLEYGTKYWGGNIFVLPSLRACYLWIVLKPRPMKVDVDIDGSHFYVERTADCHYRIYKCEELI